MASNPGSHASAVIFEENSHLRPSASDIAISINFYFKYIHRQPIWCFEREDVSDCAFLPEELAFAVLALTARFTEKREQAALHGENAKSLIMLRIANGTVDLTTIESLCLLSYSSFIGMCLGRANSLANPMQTEMSILANFISALLFSSADPPCWTSSLFTSLKIRPRSARSDSFGASRFLSSFTADKPVCWVYRRKFGDRATRPLIETRWRNPRRHHYRETRLDALHHLMQEFGIRASIWDGFGARYGSTCQIVHTTS